MANYLNNPALPKGLRNNNPGNLRRLSKKNGKDQLWNGEIPYAQSKDASFSQFYEMKFGIRAMMRDLISDIKKGHNSITKLITVYSPPNENDTAAYIKNVAAAVGLAPLAIIDLSQETIIALCKAMVIVENGKSFANYIADSDYRDAMAILGIELKKKVLS